MTGSTGRAGLRAGLSLGALVWAMTGSALAQGFTPTDRALAGGVEWRHLSIGNLAAIPRIQQVAFPVGAVASFGRLTFDVGSHWASTAISRQQEPAERIEGFTDTQVRSSYVFGRDAVVASVMVNLPTGREQLSAREQLLLSAISSSLLAFPVNSYGNGGSVTGGVAGAVPVGEWNVGVAASLRVNQRFTAIQDTVGDLLFRSGLEGRFRVGVDRLIGQSRVAAAFTYSTFGDDEFTRGQRSLVYRPGRRFIAELSLTAPVGRSLLNAYAWNFYRAAGENVNRTDADSSRAGNSENLAALGAVLSVPLSRSVTWEPGVDARTSNPQDGDAWLAGGGMAFRIRLGRRLSVVPSARLEGGVVETAGARRHSIRLWSGSVYVRRSF